MIKRISEIKDLIKLTRGRILFSIILFSILIYIILRITIFPSDPVIPLISSILQPYLLLIESFSSKILSWAGYSISILDHRIYFNSQVTESRTSLVFLKECIGVLVLIWITKATLLKRFAFTLILLISNFLFVSFYLIVFAYLVSVDPNDTYSLAIPYTIGGLGILTILLVWYLINKDAVQESLSRHNLLNRLIGHRISEIFILSYLYLIIFRFVLQYFGSYYWIKFLLWSSHKIISLTGTDLYIEYDMLVGDKGYVYITEGCLGFTTMFIFASFIYLTGKFKEIKMWIYMLAGLIIINIANILRLVFIFLKIQNTGSIDKARDLHDLSNFVIYLIVFVLWIIWIEMFVRKRQDKTV
jgi:exosortase/archaeosortase family protein